MMKRLAGAVAALAAATLVLGACSSGTDAKPKEGASGSEAGGNTLTVWAWDPAFNIYAMKEAEKVYQKDHPDFKLNVVETPWDDVQTKITTLAQSQQFKDLPDIFLMQNNAFQKNVINYPDVFSEVSVKFEEFPQSVVDYSTVDGKHYGVPFDSGVGVAAFRTDVLEQAGFKIEDFTDISWKDFLEKGKVVKEKTGHPLLSTVAGEADLTLMMLQSSGASMFDKEGKPSIADNKALKEAMQTYSDLVKAGVLVEQNSWDEYVGSFVNGNVAGVMNGAWILASVQTAKDQSGKWQITNMPKFEGLEGATNYSANGGSSWAISANANKELAQDFLAKTFAGSVELYDTILPASGAIANWIPAAKTDAYTKPQEFFQNKPIYAELVEFGAKVPSNNTGVYYYEGRAAVSAAQTQVIGGEDIDAAMKKAQETVEFAMK